MVVFSARAQPCHFQSRTSFLRPRLRSFRPWRCPSASALHSRHFRACLCQCQTWPLMNCCHPSVRVLHFQSYLSQSRIWRRARRCHPSYLVPHSQRLRFYLLCQSRTLSLRHLALQDWVTSPRRYPFLPLPRVASRRCSAKGREVSWGSANLLLSRVLRRTLSASD